MGHGAGRPRARAAGLDRARRTLLRWVGALAATVVVLGGVTPTPASPEAAPAASSPAPTPAPTPTAEVVIELFQFRPGRLTVPVGAQVQWTNRDDVVHTVTSGTPERRTGLFHGELHGKGATLRFSTTRAGTIPYFCARHDHMRGELVVQP